MMEIIKANMNIKYDNKVIFDEVPLSIKEGEIYLVIGRNGIGKSTLLRYLAKVENYDFFNSKERIHTIDHKDISYMTSDLIYYKYMTVNNLLNFYRDTNNKFSLEYAKQYLKEFNIPISKKIIKLSDGERKILAFLICLSHECKLYVIDEPFPYVDLLNDEIFRRMIVNRFDEHTTFIIATHQINEFEKIASKCILIKKYDDIEILNTDDIRSETSLSVEDYFKEMLKWKK